MINSECELIAKLITELCAIHAKMLHVEAILCVGLPEIKSHFQIEFSQYKDKEIEKQGKKKNSTCKRGEGKRGNHPILKRCTFLGDARDVFDFTSVFGG